MEKMTRKVALSLAIEALSDNAEAVAVLSSMKEQIENRLSHRSTKPTPQQEENAAIRAELLSMLTDGEKSIPQLMDGVTVQTANRLTSQRISQLLSQLKKENLVVRGDGKVATFKLASPVEDEVPVDEEC